MTDVVDVIVATSAFGMGVDKANVRFVYHLDVSDSVDAYYQGIGRAGRDGKPAEAILFYRPECSSTMRRTRLVTARKASEAVNPSMLRSTTSLSICCFKPATRTSKKS